MPDTVQCKDCGFLAILQTQPQRGLVEVDDEIRDTEIVPALGRVDSSTGIQTSYGQVEYRPWPICFVRIHDLLKECKAVTSPNKPFIVVVNKSRLFRF